MKSEAGSGQQTGRELSSNSRISTPTTALLLVGGMGTRLRAVVGSTPKPLAIVGEGSFLELILQQLQQYGIRHVVMCTGYLAEQVERKFGNGRAFNMEIEYSREQEPAGTAGAIRLARGRLRHCTDFVVMNGDSFSETDFDGFGAFHGKHSGLLSMAVRRVEDASRYGTVAIGANHRVIGFREKRGREDAGLVNAGVYIVRREVLDLIPEGPVSLEREIFPKLLDHGVYAFEQSGIFIDIGTPEDYARAQTIYQQLYAAANRK